MGRSAAHGAHSSTGAGASRSFGLFLLVCALVVAVGGGAAYALTRSGPSGASAQTVSTHSPAAPKPLEVASVTPANGATNVDPGATLSVSLSAPLAAGSPMPSLSPAVAGTWTQVSSKKLVFSATAPFVPFTHETLSIPGSTSGVRSKDGAVLPATVTSSFTVAAGNTLRLQQILAQLNYLPLSFTPTAPVAPQQAADPQPGSFAWRWSTEPASFTSQWTQGTANVITQGAVMAFENAHQMTVDGQAGPEVWGALLTALAQNQINPNSYNNVVVSTTLPEQVTVFENGASVYTTPANTGVAGAPTALGTYPVYERFTSTTMSGTNPNGTTYHDPGIPWVSYFNGGDALHGFVRASYGFPQSDGCVEMPPANAQVVYPMTPLGTLVTIE